MRAKFMAICVKILYLTIIRPLVGYIESTSNWATIGVFTPFLKNIFVVHFIQIVHGIVERN